jgi:hypothetical protein
LVRERDATKICRLKFNFFIAEIEMLSFYFGL